MQVPSRNDVPLRDFVIWLVAGAFGAFYVWWIVQLVEVDPSSNSSMSSTVCSILLVILGFCGFIARFHSKLRPWRGRWVHLLKTIKNELCDITGESRYEAEARSRSIYKLWVDTKLPEAERGYLHWFTGLFYLAAAIYAFTLCAMVVPAAMFLYLAGVSLMAWNMEFLHSLRGPELIGSLGAGAGCGFAKELSQLRRQRVKAAKKLDNRSKCFRKKSQRIE